MGPNGRLDEPVVVAATAATDSAVRPETILGVSTSPHRALPVSMRSGLYPTWSRAGDRARSSLKDRTRRSLVALSYLVHSSTTVAPGRTCDRLRGPSGGKVRSAVPERRRDGDGRQV
jgi:hypothetical protein